MAEVAVDVAMESTSQEILNLLKTVKTLVTDVSKFDWKNFWEQTATDEVFSTKFYYYETSTSPNGEKMNASVGLTAVPSTETVKGQDDFANHSAFQTIDCNFVIDEQENKTPVAIKGGNGYSDIGKVDVGVMVPLTYWGIQKFDTYYIVHFATKPHPELECTTVTPWCNKELGYGILTNTMQDKLMEFYIHHLEMQFITLFQPSLGILSCRRKEQDIMALDQSERHICCVCYG